jgi:hypothetical protein
MAAAELLTGADRQRGSSGRLPVAAVSVITPLVVQVVRMHTTRTIGACNRTQLVLHLTLAQRHV